LNRVVNEKEVSRQKPKLNVVTELFMEIKSLAKSSAEMIPVLADQHVDFKACCLKKGKYDGTLRNHYFRE
jgi:hypothetical protein